MRNNTPPQSPYRNLEEEIIEAEDGEVIYFDDEEQALAAGSEDEDADDANDAQYEGKDRFEWLRRVTFTFHHFQK